MLLIISIALAIVSVTAIVINPTLGIPLLLASKPMIDTQFDHPLIAGFTLTRIVATAVPFVIFTWMLRANREQSLRRMPMKRIWLTYAGYVSVFSILVVYNQGILDGVEVFLRHINGFIGFYMIQAFFREQKKIKPVLLAYIIGGIFPVAVGVYQMITGKVWYHQQVEGLVRSIGMYYDVLTVRLHACEPIIALLLYTSFYVRNLVLNAGALAYGLTAMVVVYRAYTKAGMLALAIWALAWTVLQKKFVKFGLIMALALLVLPFYMDTVLQQMEIIFRKEIGAVTGNVAVTATLEGRWGMWGELWNEWIHLSLLQQVFGSGMKLTYAHNDYLQMMYHGGLVGLTIFVTLLLYAGFRIMYNLWRRVDPIAVAALMLYAMYIIDSFGLVPSSYPSYQWLVWGLIGLSFRLREDEVRQASVQNGGTGIKAPTPAAHPPLKRLPGMLSRGRWPVV
jgi:hypothetical protein